MERGENFPLCLASSLSGKWRNSWGGNLKIYLVGTEVHALLGFVCTRLDGDLRGFIDHNLRVLVGDEGGTPTPGFLVCAEIK